MNAPHRHFHRVAWIAVALDDLFTLICLTSVGIAIVALRRLADAPALARQKGVAGRARLLEGGYDIRAILAAHEALYRELLC